MDYQYGMDADGGIGIIVTAPDGTEIADYAYPSSPYADAARSAPARVAAEMARGALATYAVGIGREFQPERVSLIRGRCCVA